MICNYFLGAPILESIRYVAVRELINRQTDRHRHTHTHTHTQNNYRNPALHAPRVNNLWGNCLKFRTSMEPFWDLKIGMHVEYLTHTSSKYVTSWVLHVLSLTSTAGRTSHVLLADIIPWINKTSLVLQVCTVRTLCAMLQPTRCSEAVWCCQVRLLWLKLVIVEVESWSQTPTLQLRHRHRCGLDCVRTTCILTIFYHINH